MGRVIALGFSCEKTKGYSLGYMERVIAYITSYGELKLGF
jgi:hypothetical protein